FPEVAMHLSRTADAGLVLSATLAAPRARAVEIRRQYWQFLPSFSDVAVDHFGNPWFATEKGDIAASYDQPNKTQPWDGKWLLCDSKGRIWVSAGRTGQPAEYYDGKAWHKTEIAAYEAFEDSAGRVYLSDQICVHVFSDGKCSKQQISDKDYLPGCQF